MSEQYPTQAEYQEALNEIFAQDPELYNYIMYCEVDEPARALSTLCAAARQATGYAVSDGR